VGTELYLRWVWELDEPNGYQRNGSGLEYDLDPTTNRQTGECADANGNICGDNLVYDVENRIIRKGVWWAGHPDAAYTYAPGNKRVWRGVWDGSGTQTVDELTFWSVNGQKLVTYQLSTSGSSLVAMATGTNQYFGGKLVKNATGYVTPDRLGSIGKYFPYGQERPSATTDGKEKFATYFRDSETGLDYADQRYHQPGMGRFMTPDPYSRSARSNAPGSWNRYAYTSGDPVNHADPMGLDSCDPTYGCLQWTNNYEFEWWQSTYYTGGGYTPGQQISAEDEAAYGAGVAAAGAGLASGGNSGSGAPNTGQGSGVWNSIKNFFGFGPRTPHVESTITYGSIQTPIVGPPNSFFVDPQNLGPAIRVFGPDGNANFDIHYQPNHPEVGDPPPALVE